MVKETALLRITCLIVSGVVGIILALKGLCLLEFGLAASALYQPYESLAFLHHSLATLFSHRLYTCKEDVFL